jgi:DegV family protein with EDD domain
LASRPVYVVTDAAVDLPANSTHHLPIEVLPITVSFGSRSILHGREPDLETFYRLLRESRHFPTTAAPTPAHTAERYAALLDQGYDILSIHLASSFSTTALQCARLAEELDSRRIAVVDSGQMSAGLGLMVVTCARAAAAGEPLARLEQMARAMVPRVRLAGALQSLDHVRRSGRVPGLPAAVGEFLHIKPLFEVYRGQVTLLGFSRTVRQATRRLVELVREWGPIQEMAIIHADNAGWASELVESLAEFLPSIPTIMDAGPTIVSHVGPGAVGVAALLAN